MADELRLDVIVDDHGGVQTLEKLDEGVAKVTTTAEKQKSVLDELGKRYGVNTVRVSEFHAANVAAEAGTARFAGLLAGVGVGALTLYAGALSQAAREADGLKRASDNLEAPAARLSQLAAAAANYEVTGERLNGVLERFRQHLASGQIDGKLRDIGIELDAFKDKNVAEQFLDLTDAIGGMENSLDRVDARVKLLGPDTQDMAAMMTKGFRDATDGARGMKEDTIQFMDALIDSIKTRAREAASLSKNLAADSLLALANAFGRRGFLGPAAAADQPTAPLAPARDLPAGPDPRRVDLDESRMRHLELLQQEQESWFRIDEIMRQIGETQDYIVRRSGDWSDVLNARVATAVEGINAKYVQAVMLNHQLRGGAVDERDRLMQQLTATTDPNASEFDQRFNAIDQEAKRKLAAVDQTDRVSAAAAENAILEEMNLKVLELQQKWDGVTNKVNTHKAAIDGLGQSYGGGARGGPAFGQQLPGGLVMPTADQVATGRYFGPVDANGRPDPARMAGATPMVTHHTTINAQGSLIDSPSALDDLIRRIELGLDERDRNQGGASRR